MTIDSEIARRTAAQFDVAAHIDAVRYLVKISAEPRRSDMRRLMNLQRTVADLVEMMASGQDFDREVAVVGACAQEWLEDRAAELAACLCPLQVGVPSEDRFVTPGCPAHDGGGS